MPESILDGTGRGYRAAVDPANRLKVDAISSTFQHFVAHTESNGYHIIGTATPVNGTVNIIHIKNVDSNNLELGFKEIHVSLAIIIHKSLKLRKKSKQSTFT